MHFYRTLAIADGAATFTSEKFAVKKLTYLHRNNNSAKEIEPEKAVYM